MSINAAVYQSVIERNEKIIFLPYRDLIDRPRIMPVMEHDARFVHLEIFERLKMPPRLLAHLTLVHDAEKWLLKEIAATFPKVKIDKELALFGAATHDIGKCVCKNELTQPGREHEAQGQKLLLSLGASPQMAAFAKNHSTWSERSSIESLLVSLADKIWKGSRVAELEDLVASKISQASALEKWEAYLLLDDIIQKIASGADKRLAWQNQFEV